MNYFCPLSLSVNFTMKIHNVYRDTLHTSKEKLQDINPLTQKYNNIHTN